MPASFYNSQEYIAVQIAQFEERTRVLQGIVDEGPIVRGTATGYEQVDNRTCTCKSYGPRRKDHSEDCSIKIVTDSSQIIAAIKELRLESQALDGLRQQLVPPDESGEIAEFLRTWDEILAENKALKARVGELEAQRLGILPARPREAS